MYQHQPLSHQPLSQQPLSHQPLSHQPLSHQPQLLSHQHHLLRINISSFLISILSFATAFCLFVLPVEAPSRGLLASPSPNTPIRLRFTSYSPTCLLFHSPQQVSQRHSSGSESVLISGTSRSQLKRSRSWRRTSSSPPPPFRNSLRLLRTFSTSSNGYASQLPLTSRPALPSFKTAHDHPRNDYNRHSLRTSASVRGCLFHSAMFRSSSLRIPSPASFHCHKRPSAVRRRHDSFTQESRSSAMMAGPDTLDRTPQAQP